MADTAEVIEVQAEVIEPAKDIQVSCTKAIIKDNLASIEAYVDEQLKPYIGAVIDPADDKQVSEGRTCMADLNKLKGPIESERMRIKKEYEAPLKAFEARVKQITGKIEGARAAIKDQVDAADKAFKAGRRSLLEEEFTGCAGPLEGLLEFERILDSTWLNRSTPETKALKGMQDAVIDAIEKYETLVASGLRHRDECVKLFCETLDLQQALALDGQLAEKEREAAEFAAKRAAAEAGVAATSAAATPAAPVSAPIPVSQQLTHRWMLHIEFDGPKSLAVVLKEALVELGINGGTIKDMGVVGYE